MVLVPLDEAEMVNDIPLDLLESASKMPSVNEEKLRTGMAMLMHFGIIL